MKGLLGQVLQNHMTLQDLTPMPLATLLIVSVLSFAKLLWASEKNEFQVIPESMHVYKGQIKTTDNTLRNVEVELFTATRPEAGKKLFVSAIMSWDPISGFFYWTLTRVLDNREAEQIDLEDKNFEVASYLSKKNIYLSKIGIASWNLFNGEVLLTRGFANQARTLNDARNGVLTQLNEMTLAQLGAYEFSELLLWKYVSHSFFRGSLPCGICKTRAKLTSVRVADGHWIISISGGYKTDAELVLDANFDIRKICVHPSAEQTQ